VISHRAIGYVFLASDDAAAASAVGELAEQLGFAAVKLGGFDWKRTFGSRVGQHVGQADLPRPGEIQ